MFVRTEPNGSQACCAYRALIRVAGEQGAQGAPMGARDRVCGPFGFCMRGHRTLSAPLLSHFSAGRLFFPAAQERSLFDARSLYVARNSDGPPQ